ncbi:glycosyltransferase 87 family protein [Actinokineospora auranticolor]|uniref:Alpha-1,2-mannosyltransferase n=1 Tax=Actinokineospora auranticolor TaxID=155976 RepID=A0A2S6GK86_9PSEU|nr:glycosyltransferase 87 family protein [Actinokineospora auranticolor]PPK65629.1 alpha-1,2-mannosyltransferase [Actinokineospora auranticolor]
MDWSTALRVHATTITVGAVTTALAVFCWLADTPLGIDSAVYRAGGYAVLHGQSLYAHLSAIPAWSPDLPFTYTPFAAMVFAPFSALPPQLCWGVLSLAAAPALHVSLRPFTTSPLPLIAAFALQPVWQSIGLGQVNLILMAAVVADVLLLGGSRYCGVAIGIVAAIKLIPLIFIAHLLLTRRVADAARALAAFVVATGLGFLVLPADSIHYMTTAMFNRHFADAKGWVGNQSWQAFVARTFPDGPQATFLVIGATAAFVLTTAWLVRRLPDDRVALLATAGCSLLISPISWTHHWVWVVPAIGLLWQRRKHTLALATAFLFTGWTINAVPAGDERAWDLPRAVFGNAYLLALLTAACALIAVSSGKARRPTGQAACRRESSTR